MNNFLVKGETTLFVSDLGGSYGLSFGNAYVVLSEEEADRLARYWLFGEGKPQPEVDTPTEEVVDSGTEGENG